MQSHGFSVELFEDVAICAQHGPEGISPLDNQLELESPPGRNLSCAIVAADIALRGPDGTPPSPKGVTRTPCAKSASNAAAAASTSIPTGSQPSPKPPPRSQKPSPLKAVAKLLPPPVQGGARGRWPPAAHPKTTACPCVTHPQPLPFRDGNWPHRLVRQSPGGGLGEGPRPKHPNLTRSKNKMPIPQKANRPKFTAP